MIAAGFDGGRPSVARTVIAVFAGPAERPRRRQEETRAAASAVASKREAPAEIEEKEKEPATAAARPGLRPSNPEPATKPAAGPMQFDDDDLGHTRLPQ